mmetsp:Transcript_43881/g.115848  ORF Transcript_43881/g.115848 Transcript_43881/m.115848 type:complete len:677 (-) Transcript_43881:82-2112(-)
MRGLEGVQAQFAGFASETKAETQKEHAKFSDEYYLGRAFGRGWFSYVYTCMRIDTREKLAVKRVSKARTPVPKIEQEVQMLDKLAHPCVVKLHGAFDEEDSVFIVLDLHRGGDLVAGMQLHWEAKGPIPVAAVRRLGAQILGALAWVHSKDVVHRDVKADNYLMDRTDLESPNCRLCLSDFGTAAGLAAGERLREKCGTRSYWSPELYAQDYGSKVDVWAAGIIVYGLLTGNFPFSSGEEVMRKPLHIPSRGGQDAGCFLAAALHRDESQRLTAADALAHTFLTASPPAGSDEAAATAAAVPVQAVAAAPAASAGGGGSDIGGVAGDEARAEALESSSCSKARQVAPHHGQAVVRLPSGSSVRLADSSCPSTPTDCPGMLESSTLSLSCRSSSSSSSGDNSSDNSSDNNGSDSSGSTRICSDVRLHAGTGALSDQIQPSVVGKISGERFPGKALARGWFRVIHLCTRAITRKQHTEKRASEGRTASSEVAREVDLHYKLAHPCLERLLVGLCQGGTVSEMHSVHGSTVMATRTGLHQESQSAILPSAFRSLRRQVAQRGEWLCGKSIIHRSFELDVLKSRCLENLQCYIYLSSLGVVAHVVACKQIKEFFAHMYRVMEDPSLYKSEEDRFVNRLVEAVSRCGEDGNALFFQVLQRGEINCSPASEDACLPPILSRA